LYPSSAIQSGQKGSGDKANEKIGRVDIDDIAPVTVHEITGDQQGEFRIPWPTFTCQWTSLYIYPAAEGIFRPTVAP
jgi:hypothetical protein